MNWFQRRLNCDYRVLRSTFYILVVLPRLSAHLSARCIYRVRTYTWRGGSIYRQGASHSFGYVSRLLDAARGGVNSHNKRVAYWFCLNFMNCCLKTRLSAHLGEMHTWRGGAGQIYVKAPHMACFWGGTRSALARVSRYLDMIPYRVGGAKAYKRGTIGYRYMPLILYFCEQFRKLYRILLEIYGRSTYIHISVDSTPALPPCCEYIGATACS